MQHITKSAGRHIDTLCGRLGQGYGRERHVEKLGQLPLRRDRREVNGFLAWPLEGALPYLGPDAIYLKVLDGGRIVSRAVIMAVTANQDGSERFWALRPAPRKPRPSGAISCVP